MYVPDSPESISDKPLSPVLSCVQPIDKKMMRIIKNREAAQNSRKRKKEQLESFQQRALTAEAQVEKLRQQVERLSALNAGLVEENKMLKSKLNIQEPLPTLDVNGIESMFNGQLPEFGALFSVFVFSLASFLVPSFSKPLDSHVTPLSLSVPQAELVPYATRADISLDKNLFIKTLDNLAAINPPNAIMSVQSLFSTGKQLGAKLAYIPQDGQPVLMMEPDIQVIPYQKSDCPDLCLSLLASVPSSRSPTEHIPGGMLQLDVRVFSAAFLTI